MIKVDSIIIYSDIAWKVNEIRVESLFYLKKLDDREMTLNII